MITRQQYYRYIEAIASSVQQKIGKSYNRQVSDYFHGLLERYPDPISTDEITKEVMKRVGINGMSPTQVIDKAEQIIDKAEQIIRQNNNGSLPFGAMMRLRMLRQQYRR